MAKSKQSKSQKKDGKYRNETRDERRTRVKEQVEAREKCMKMLPFGGGLILVLALLFGVYVHSVPPSPIPQVSAQEVQQEKKAYKLPEIPLTEEQKKLKENPKVAAALEQAARELQVSLKKMLEKKKAEEAAAKAAEEAKEGDEPEAEL